MLPGQRCQTYQNWDLLEKKSDWGRAVYLGENEGGKGEELGRREGKIRVSKLMW